MIAGIEMENVLNDPDHAHFKSGLSSLKLGLDMFYLCAKFDD